MNVLLRYQVTGIILAIILLYLLTACDSGAGNQGSGISSQGSVIPTPNTQPPTPGPTGTVVDAAAVAQPPTPDENVSTPIEATVISTGTELTALQALAALKPKALAWKSDARLGLLSNARPGQAVNLLSDALGRPEINEPTPGGKGRNWTLLAFSPSARGAVGIGMDGTQVDLIKEGTVTDDVVSRFTGPDTAALSLSGLDPARLADSDKIASQAGERGKAADMGIALLSPTGLGLGPLPAPQAGGAPPQLVYELFSGQNEQQTFIFFDASTGAVVLDSSKP